MAPVSVDEYLKMSFDGPAAEYLDGEIRERSLGSIPHFEAQERMLEFFRALKESYSIFAYPEVTLRMSASRYRIADVAAFQGRPRGKYPNEVTVEIVSEDDRYVDIKENLASYRSNSGLHEVPAFELPEFGARFSAADLFAD